MSVKLMRHVLNRSTIKWSLLLLTLLLGIASAKPKLRVASDGFPTGPATPEGAATDLARAFMQGNSALFRSICIHPYGAGQSRSEYVEYLQNVEVHLKQQNALGARLLDNPVRITKVFAARHLSKNGPASYGYASFDFQDVMFVDIEVALYKGSKLLRRTLMIKDRDEKCYALPVPDVSPLLSDGVYEETPSRILVTDVYDVERSSH